ISCEAVIARTNAPLAPFRCSGFSGNVAPPRSRHRWHHGFAPTSQLSMPSISRRNIERRRRKRGEPHPTVRSPPPAGPGSHKWPRHLLTVTTSFESPRLRPRLPHAVPYGTNISNLAHQSTPRVEVASAASDPQVTDRWERTSPLSFAA